VLAGVQVEYSGTVPGFHTKTSALPELIGLLIALVDPADHLRSFVGGPAILPALIGVITTLMAYGSRVRR